MASHEFRTPLGTILSSVSLLEKYFDMEDSAEKRDKHVGRIKNSVRNLTNVLNDFLSLDKLQSGLVQANRTSLNLRELLNEVCDELEQVKRKNQVFILEYQGEEEMVADPHILENIVYNLVSNAVKYSEEGGEIKLSSKMTKKRFILEVCDEGIGIPQEDQKHLFERFFRAENAINIQGTGLGLNIVGKYLELLKGKITFESVEGEGTCFTISIPREP